jgi:hypothetical protein
MQKHTIPYLQKRCARLRKQLATLEPLIIRGSLIEQYKRCGKSGCKCMTGKGHGPKYYLSLSVYKGKSDVIYVPLNQVEKVKEYLQRYATFNSILKELCDINRELLRRDKAL